MEHLGAGEFRMALDLSGAIRQVKRLRRKTKAGRWISSGAVHELSGGNLEKRSLERL